MRRTELMGGGLVLTLSSLQQTPVSEWAHKPMEFFGGRSFADLQENDIRHLAQLAALDADKWLAMHQSAKAVAKAGSNDHLIERIHSSLWKHQKDFLIWSMNRSWAGCWDGLATGKTLTFLEMLRLRLKTGNKCLWIAPKNPLSNLPKAFDDFPHVKRPYILCTGSGTEKMRKLQYERDIYFTNPESFQDKKFCEYVTRRGFVVVVIDEAHKFTNYTAQQTRNMAEVIKTIPSRWLLTGTPFETLEQKWMMAYLMDLGATFGSDYNAFINSIHVKERRRLGSGRQFDHVMSHDEIKAEIEKIEKRASRGPIDEKSQLRLAQLKSGDEIQTSLEDRFKRFFAENSMCRRIEDCHDMPPIREIVHNVELSKAELENYDRIGREFLLLCDDQETPIAHKAAVQNYLRQACGGGHYAKFQEGEKVRREYQRVGRSKLDATLELIKAHGGQTVVACAFRADIFDLEQELTKVGLNVVTFAGGMKVDEITSSRQKFMDGKADVAVMFSGMGEGLDGLQCARLMIRYSRLFSRKAEIQLAGRIHRPHHSGGASTYIDLNAVDGRGRDLMDLQVRTKIETGVENMNEILEATRRHVKERLGG